MTHHGDPYAWSWEPFFLALCVLAAVVYVRAARREEVRPLRIVSFFAGLLLIVAALNSPDRDAGRPLPAPRPPAPERDDRRLGAAAPPARPDAGDGGRTGPARRKAARRAHAPEGRAARVARGLVRHPLRGFLRRGASQPLAPVRGACRADRDRAPLLVARHLREAEPALDARLARLPGGRVRRLGVPRARAHVRDAARLRLLRDRRRACGGSRRPRIRTTRASS